MPAAIAMSVREELVRRRQQGETLWQIARALGVSYNAVRRIWQQYQREGEVKPHYERCRPPAVRKQAEVHQEALRLKETHPGWGAGLIRLEMAERFVAEDLPSERTLQRWFRRAGVGRKQKDSLRRQRVARGQQPHGVWAMDAKERMVLGDGSPASWLTITDEASGAILSVTLFPHRLLEPVEPTPRQTGVADDDGTVGATRSDAHGQRCAVGNA